MLGVYVMLKEAGIFWSKPASAEKAEAVSPPLGCLHLNRGLGRLKCLQGHPEQFHGRGLGLGGTVQI